MLTYRPMTDQQIKVLSMSMTNVVVRAAVEGSHFSGEQVAADRTSTRLNSSHELPTRIPSPA